MWRKAGLTSASWRTGTISTLEPLARIPDQFSLILHEPIAIQAARWLILRQARHNVHAVPSDLTRPGRVQARVVTGDPATEVSRVANEIEADLVVAGVPRRNAFARGLFGVTASRLLRVVHAPMLAVPDRSGREDAQPERAQLSLAA